MNDKLRELAGDWRVAADAHDEIGFGAAADVGRTCADELLALIDAEGDGGAVDRVEAHKSYDAIDRWLRNNMDDEEYAEYSTGLDRVFSYNTRPARSGVVSDEDAENVLSHYIKLCIKHHDDAPKSARIEAMRVALETFMENRK